MNSPSRAIVTVVVMVVMTSVGCVSQDVADQLREDNHALRAQNQELQGRMEQLQSELDVLRDQPPRQDPDLLAELERLQQAKAQQRSEFDQAMAEARQRIEELSQRRAQIVGGPLPQELDDALERLAQRHPDLMRYDRDRGMIRFASDLTFDLGSAEVRQQADEGLRQLARIVRDLGGDYELRIVGHTDDVPVTNPENVRRFEDNWGLSAFRAISVMRKLSEMGISEQRMAVVGHGEHHPAVPHQRDDQGRPRGTEANRRVEIFLVSASYDGEAGEAGDRQPRQAAPQQPRPVQQAEPQKAEQAIPDEVMK